MLIEVAETRWVGFDEEDDPIRNERRRNCNKN